MKTTSPLPPGETKQKKQEKEEEEQNGVYISLENLGYSVQKRGFPCVRNSERKEILKEISCVIRPGSLTAIIGPSGAGKSTFMDTLACKRMEGTKTGRILMNGEETSSSFRKQIGYCTQEDKLHSDLTVFETFLFSAQFLLPDSLTSEQYEQVAEEMVVRMRLEKARNTMISQVSGGERRRVSVGCALINNPKVLLGDEVTSGLDSYSATGLIGVLKNLANSGSTVIISIHQPSSLIFHMFDNVILLCEGHLIYSGAVKTSLKYFQSLGYSCPPGMSISDFLLELVCNGNEGEKEKEEEEEWGSKTRFDVAYMSGEEGGGMRSCGEEEYSLLCYPKPPVLSPQELSHRFFSHSSEFAFLEIPSSPTHENDSYSTHSFSSSLSPKTSSSLPSSFGSSFFEPFGEIKPSEGFSRPWYKQVGILVKRRCIRWGRDPFQLFQIFMTFGISALIVGLLYSSIDQNAEQQYVLGAAFSQYLIGIMTFNTIGAFLSERLLFSHEASAGYYYTSAFYASHSVLSFLLSVPLLFMTSAILYFLIDFPSEGDGGPWRSFFYYFLACFGNYHAFLALTEFLGACFNELEVGMAVGSLFLTISMSLSGVVVNFNNIPSYLIWLYWCNHVTYIVSATLSIIFDGVPLKKYFLHLFGVQIDNIATNLFIVLGFIAFYRSLSYLALRFLHRT